MALVFIMKRKILLCVILSVVLLPNVILADDGELKFDTDIITNTGQENNRKNYVESKYAPNLFLNRTKKVVEEKNQTINELLQEAKTNVFKREKISIYTLNTKTVKKSLFVNYQMENFIAMKSKSKKIQNAIVNVITSLFFMLMIVLGIFLGRKWHGLRKNRINN